MQPTPASSYRVFLVDDQRIVVEAVRRALSADSDIAFGFCCDSFRAVAEAEAFKPTVLLLDLVMPGLDGMAVLRDLRASAALADLPVVVLSAREDATMKAEAFAGGANDYLIKLPDARELAARVRYHSRAYLAGQQLALRQRELEEANRKLAEADQAKGRFLASMSHEIRTPMNGVIGVLQVLMNRVTDADQLRLLSVAYDSSSSLLALLNDILNFSKVDAEAVEFRSEPFSVLDLVDEVSSLFGQTALEKGVELVHFVGRELCERRSVGDPGRLRQILANLLGNAVKFTSSGSVRLQATRIGEQLRFEVSDTGIGIAPDVQGRLFQAFSQADSTISQQYGGTGLGLVICRRLAEGMRGKVGVDSRPGEGSTFWVTLPWTAGESIAQAPPSCDPTAIRMADGVARQVVERLLFDWNVPIKADGAEAARWIIEPRAPWVEEARLLPHPTVVLGSSDLQLPAEWPVVHRPLSQRELLRLLSDSSQHAAPAQLAEKLALGSSLQVLVVEDNPVNQMVAEHLLGLLGCTAHFAGDGEHAVQAVESEKHFALVLMDCNMPIMDGYTATRLIREWEQRSGRPRVPIVALSAHSAGKLTQRGRDAGMDDFLAKPYKLEELRDVLSRNLSRS